jgi:hypothetical protein
MRRALTTAAALLIAAPAFAQNEAARRQATEINARVAFEKPVTGAPYSAETVIESSQLLADGNRITRKTTGRVYRDGEGRVRREEDRPDGTMMISIVDPVAGSNYSLDPERKIAWKTATAAAGILVRQIESKIGEARIVGFERIPLDEAQKMTAEELDSRKRAAEERLKAEAARSGAGGSGEARGGGGGRGGAMSAPAIARGGGGAGGRARGGVRSAAPGSTVPLERRTLEGVTVEGHRTTTVIPAGQIGNEQPITITSEEWRSPELGVLVVTKHSDPRTGESTYRLQNVIRAEPDRSLFMVPADYTVRETGIRRQ